MPRPKPTPAAATSYGLLSHDELVRLVEQGVIEGVKPESINAASIDIHLGSRLIAEQSYGHTVDYSGRGPFMSHQIDMDNTGYVLAPKEFVLAQSVEVFNLPNDISCEYKLKSSMARCGLEHLNAGWCDAGWNGSVLTLELTNMLRYHSIQIRPGDAIGQMVFFRHAPVAAKDSYAARGRYNNDKDVVGIKP